MIMIVIEKDFKWFSPCEISDSLMSLILKSAAFLLMFNRSLERELENFHETWEQENLISGVDKLTAAINKTRSNHSQDCTWRIHFQEHRLLATVGLFKTVKKSWKLNVWKKNLLNNHFSSQN